MFEKISNSQFVQFISKRKWLYHVIFWVSYTMFWHVSMSPKPFVIGSMAISLSFATGDIFAVYTNLYLWMPKFLYKKKYLQYLLLNVITIFLGTVIIALLWYASVLYFWNPDISFFDFVHDPFVSSSLIGSTFGVVFLTSAVKLVKRSFESERRAKKLEKEKMETELKFLKSQLNPHFLFNVLNNIYFLIKKDPDTAAESLANFSDILRYQLYGSESEQIFLKEELTLLENFIKLSEIRQNDFLTINLHLDQNINGEQIAPLLLIPFVENAFKHVSKDKSKKNEINIDLSLHENELLFKVKNTIEKNKNEANLTPPDVGGIGLTNVKRRLDLLYPKNHKLSIEESKEWFTVELNLKLI